MPTYFELIFFTEKIEIKHHRAIIPASLPIPPVCLISSFTILYFPVVQ